MLLLFHNYELPVLKPTNKFSHENAVVKMENDEVETSSSHVNYSSDIKRRSTSHSIEAF